MRLWRRRDGLEARLIRLEERIDDVADSSNSSFELDLLDDLAQRVGEVALMVPAQEDLLDLRLHTARVATDVARLAAELHASIDRSRAEAVEDIADVAARLDALRTAVLDLTDEANSGRATLRRA